MSMFSLVTALVSQHVLDELRSHKGLLSDLLHSQADVVCLQPTDAVCLLQGDWENIKHAYMVLEEFYYKAQAQNAIQSMLTPAHGGGDINVYDAEPALDYRCEERLKASVNCSTRSGGKDLYTSPVDDQSRSLDLSQTSNVNVKQRNVAITDGNQAKHSSVDDADCEMKYSPPDENIVYLSDTSDDVDDAARVMASVNCPGECDTGQRAVGGREKTAAAVNIAAVVSTTTAIDGSSIDSCSHSPVPAGSDNKAQQSLFTNGASTDDSVQRVLAHMPSLAGMFPQLLHGDNSCKSEEPDVQPSVSDTDTPTWAMNSCSDTTFPSAPALYNQPTTDGDDQPQQCGMCAMILANTTALQEHIIKVHAGRNHCCLYCSQTFVLYTDYVRHQKTHLAKYTCPVCGKVYRSDSRLREHTRTHDKDYVKVYHSCPKCGRLFTHKYNMQVHLKTQHFGWQTNRRYFCKLCGEKFAKPTLLREHETTQHNASPKRHRCTVCGAVLSSYDNLMAHRRIVHREAGNVESKPSGSQNNIPA